MNTKRTLKLAEEYEDSCDGLTNEEALEEMYKIFHRHGYRPNDEGEVFKQGILNSIQEIRLDLFLVCPSEHAPKRLH